VVFISGRDNPLLIAIEEAIAQTGAHWTMLRPSWFNQNFSEGFLVDAVLSGEIALPMGEGREAFVDADDIAAVAVAAFEDDRHIGQAYTLSGPRLLSFEDVAAEISKVNGKPLKYVPLSQEAFRESLRERGFPESLADGYAEIEQDRNAFVSNDFERVLGRPPTDFAAFAKQQLLLGSGLKIRPAVYPSISS